MTLIITSTEGASDSMTDHSSVGDQALLHLAGVEKNLTNINKLKLSVLPVILKVTSSNCFGIFCCLDDAE